MKEKTFQNIKILKKFYQEVIKWTIICYFVCLLIIVVFEVLRVNPLSYIIGFFICLGINYFRTFFKKDVRKDFYENN
jgi:L-asparagine transporter-like permease